jgi:excisionase family DNA binding protein
MGGLFNTRPRVRVRAACRPAHELARAPLTFSHLDRARLLEMASLVTQAEAARILGVSRQRVGELVEEGRLATVLIGGRRWIFRFHLEVYRVKRKGRGK